MDERTDFWRIMYVTFLPEAIVKTVITIVPAERTSIYIPNCLDWLGSWVEW